MPSANKRRAHMAEIGLQRGREVGAAGELRYVDMGVEKGRRGDDGGDGGDRRQHRAQRRVEPTLAGDPRVVRPLSTTALCWKKIIHGRDGRADVGEDQREERRW